MTDEELEKLKERFPADYKERIDRLSGYIESKGAKYKSHYATILNWAKRDEETTNRASPAKNNGFANFEQNQYDYDDLEKRLLAN